MAELETDYLAHHGIKGQKWGIRRTPEQLGHKPKGSARKKNVKDTIKKTYENAKQKRAASKENAKVQARNMLKKYMRKHPELLPYFAEGLTRDEVDDVIKNIEYDRKINKIRDDELDRKWRQRQRMANNIGTISNLINNSKNLYNNSIEIANHFRDPDKQIRKVGERKEKDHSAIDKIVRTGSAKDVMSNISNLSSKELEDAMKRLNYQDKLDERIKKAEEAAKAAKG